MEQEGVIKYQLIFERRVLDIDTASLRALNESRQEMTAHSLIGQDEHRYEGFGFGNLSLRARAPQSCFWISGTQTGQIQTLTPKDVCLVTDSVPAENKLTACGEVRPSSESMTHSVLYQLSPKINAVIHVHSPDIWSNRKRLSLVATPAELPYGTPEMAEAVSRLSAQLMKNEWPLLFCMDGHEDGVIAAGESLSQCTKALLTSLHRAQSCT